MKTINLECKKIANLNCLVSKQVTSPKRSNWSPLHSD